MPSTLTLPGPLPFARVGARTAALRLLLLGLLQACAQGIEPFEENGNIRFDGGTTLDASPIVRDTGGQGALDTGSVTPPEDVWVPPPEAGGSVDSSTGPSDAGTTPVRDATGPAPSDAAVDTSTPSTPDTSTPSTPDTGTTTPDTGTSTPDSGTTTPDTGTTNPTMCMGTPAYPTTTACARCTCMRCAQQVATCYASNESAKNTQCAAVQACAEANKCVDRDCYCGKDTSDLACINNQNGACEQVIETAAGTDSALDVSRAGDDPQNPVGRAALIGACQLANCRSECGL
jgi:hypothetical protein